MFDLAKLSNYFYFSKQMGEKVEKNRIFHFNLTYSLWGSQGA